MFKRLIENIRFRATARQYALRLGPQILKDYGWSKHYSMQQIEKSVARAKLPIKHIHFGYAMFMDETGFLAMDRPEAWEEYAQTRSVLARYSLHSPSAGFQPAPENSDAISSVNLNL